MAEVLTRRCKEVGCSSVLGPAGAGPFWAGAGADARMLPLALSRELREPSLWQHGAQASSGVLGKSITAPLPHQRVLTLFSFLFGELLRPKERERDGEGRLAAPQGEGIFPARRPRAAEAAALGEAREDAEASAARAKRRAAAAEPRGARKMARGGSEADAVWDPGES